MQPKLIFIHGFMGQSSDWDVVREKLHGNNPDMETGTIDLEAAADWESGIEELAAKIETHCVLVGYSMGARIALGLVAEFPNRFPGLIFVSGNPGLPSDNSRRERLESDLRIADQIADFEDADAVEQFLDPWYRQNVFANLPESIRLAEIRRKSNFDWTRWPDLLRTYSVGQQPDYWSALREISIPVCVVAGEGDAKYRDIAMRAGEASSSQVEMQIVADCGHIVHREKPEEFVQIVENFMTRLR